MRLLFKNTLKKIKNSFGRFLSIMLIIALGTSVFMGLHEATTGMLYTADNYYDNYNLMDFKITSTYGLNKDDIESLKKLTNAKKVIPSYSIDVLSEGEAIRIHALEKEVNNVILVSGTMPKNNNECLGDYAHYKVGDIITFNGKFSSDFLSINNCKVVGTIKSLLYIQSEKGISKVGNGRLVSFVFVLKDSFTMDYYTEAYVMALEALEKNSYYYNYSDQIVFLKSELEELKPIRETIRYEELLTTINNEIILARKTLNEEVGSATLKLNDTKKLLDKSKEELTINKNNGITEYNKNYQELTDNKNNLLATLTSMDLNESNLSSYLDSLSALIDNLENDLTSLTEGSSEYLTLLNEINDLVNKYNDLMAIMNNLTEINNNLTLLNSNYANFQTEISYQERILETSYQEYEESLLNLNTMKEKTERQITEAQEKSRTLERPIWYLLDRTSNSGYSNYKEDVIKVDAIAKVLPVFFIIIVILMISNTLTRLIEEERTEIGILLSNGFSKVNINFSYLVYVFLAGLIGLGIGLTIGYSLIPKIIYGVFLARYYLPKIVTIVSTLPFSLVIITTLLVMTTVTIFACYKELLETPASLLRPKAPKSGKKVIFENSKLLWSKFSFMWKVTIRNLFRYKKRIVMTVLGVAGCTALLVAGFGIRDSINVVSKLQYENIIKYDSMYILNKGVSTIDNDLQEIFRSNSVVNPLLINQNAFTFSFDNKKEDAYLIVPSDTIAFNNYVTLKSTLSNKIISINDNGVIITKQMAELLNVTKGDTINIRNSDNELVILYVNDIVENYVSHYIYMSANYYREIFNQNITYNTIIADGKVNNNVSLTDYNILTVNYTSDILETFNSFVQGLNKIIVMIVIFACFLALIVLYNLTIINVSERKREIATFKVLGFYDNEVSSFVYRETIILTIIGICLGLFFGIYLHHFIIDTAQTNNIMFLRTIKWESFVIAALITIIFSYIVQLMIKRTLKKINMIDSLKSVE